MKLPAILLVLLSSTCTTAQVKQLYQAGWLYDEEDTLRGNIKKLTEYSTSLRDSAIKIYTYDAAAKTVTGQFYSSQKLLGKWIAQYDVYGNIVETLLYCEDTIPSTIRRVQYDAKGRKKEDATIEYHEGCQYLTNWFIDGIVDYAVSTYPIYSTTLYSYDSAGRLSLDITRDYKVGDPGTLFTTNTYKYGTNTQLTEKEEKTWGGRHRPMQIRTTKYDSKGREAEFSFTSSATDDQLSGWFNGGKPIIKRTVNVYDSSGNIAEMKEYANDEHRSYEVPRTLTTYTYDNMGNMISYSVYNLYRDENGTESRQLRLTRPVEKSKEQVARDKHGNIVRRIDNSGREMYREIEYF